MGGSGKDAKNLLTLYQLPELTSYDFESSFQIAIVRSEDVTLMAKGVRLIAYVTILNKK